MSKKPNILKQLEAILEANNWTLEDAIEETLKVARQDSNLSAKLQAIKFLHELTTVSGSQEAPADSIGAQLFDPNSIASALIGDTPYGQSERRTEKDSNTEVSEPDRSHRPPDSPDSHPGIASPTE